MKISHSTLNKNFDELPFNEFWSKRDNNEIRMHKIHTYPAKFPSLVVSKAIEFASEKDTDISKIADVFCGCGTTALEAAKNKINFWGCDINPVATLITRVKCQQYSDQTLRRYFKSIIDDFKTSHYSVKESIENNERIHYWYSELQVKELNSLLLAILNNTPRGKYREFFLCAFSNILKATSRWLTKSIKPQVDPDKIPADVEEKYTSQFKKMRRANKESKEIFSKSSDSSISTKNFLEMNFSKGFADLVVTSPPYVTSYEYADLHQLSTLWLGYAEDYRELREGTIGSLYHQEISDTKIARLPKLGKDIYEEMETIGSRKARSVAKYFIDIQNSVEKIYQIMNNDGYTVFVIGNTKYKGIKVDNAKFLITCMIQTGFKNIEIVKRKISSKILTPYRDDKGRFSSDPTDNKVYNHEFIVTGKK